MLTSAIVDGTRIALKRKRPSHQLSWRAVAGFADYDPVLLRRALLGEAGSGSAGLDLFADAIECAEDETGA